MNLFRKTDVTCILATDFSGLSEEQRLWREQHAKKFEVYQKYNELIEYLEYSLEILVDPISQKKIRRQIKKLKKLRDSHNEPSILSIRFERELLDNEEPKTPVLKLKKRENYE